MNESNNDGHKTMVRPSVSPFKVGAKNYLDEKHFKILSFLNDVVGSHNEYFFSSEILTALAKKLGISVRKLRQRLNKLTKYHYIGVDKTYKPYCYSLLEKGKDAVKFFKERWSQSASWSLTMDTMNLDRPHDIWVNLLIKDVNKPANWNNTRLNLIKLKFPDYKHSPLKGTDIYRFAVDTPDKIVWVRSTPDKFIVECFGRKSTELFNQPYQVGREIIKIVEQVAKKLESIFKVPLVIENKVTIEISRESHALILNQFADILLKLKDSIKSETGKEYDIAIYDENGEKIAEPDRSLGVYLPEYDFPQAKTSEQLAQRTKTFIDEQILKEGYKKDKENLSATIDSLNELATETAFLAKQVNVHIPFWEKGTVFFEDLDKKFVPAIETMAKKVEELTTIVKRKTRKQHRKKVLRHATFPRIIKGWKHPYLEWVQDKTGFIHARLKKRWLNG
jgi:hypothetical protein